MELDVLKDRLKVIEGIPEKQWLDGLNKRKKEELTFHDAHRDTSRMGQLDKKDYEKLYGNKKYYQPQAAMNVYVDNWIAQNAKGRIFLDYACGNGVNAIKAAKAGASLAIGLDISRVSVENAKNEARRLGLENTYFVQADAENTMLLDNSVDVAICSGMLHHLDLSYAFPELRRILTPGGRILGVESLDYNPLFKLYRCLTAQMRTVWEKEHILSYKDLEFAGRFFQVKEVRHWYLFAIAGAHFPGLLPLFNRMDNFVLSLPLLRRLAWIFTFELHKKEN